MINKADNDGSLLYRGLVGNSPAVARLRDLIDKIAASKSNVLISGETGSGKEIVARNIHCRSAQSEGRFVPINCAAIPPDLLESELFGHKKGAFTGALSDRDGRFMFAAGGTLFLDEIGDMSPSLQVKMLRVLEERVIYRVGCNEPIPMTARLIAATHRNLEQSVAEGSFREDLFYRLNVVPVDVPALRERKGDLAVLAEELGHRLIREHGVSVNLSPAAIASLQAHEWPGNVRELANLIERLAVIHPNGTVDITDLPEQYRHSPTSPSNKLVLAEDLSAGLVPVSLPKGGMNLKNYLRTTEAALIKEALEHSNGTMTDAASLLQIGRTTLTDKVKRLGLTASVRTSI